ncbi:DMT family transporter [Tropicimonas sp. IMCC34043]|uniref:DMT family transporter n=1 Tax=Tropicimonas sp. IMCC34043 TaxID=2248760 RepID=UPI000E282EBD|nr:DMT family transporter [Tropicimonas sp. IMCC34043]
MIRTDTSPPLAIPSDSAALALSALAAVLWGTNFEATHIVLQAIGPWTAAASRFVIAAAAILLWLGASRGLDRAVLRRNALAFGVLGVVGVAGFNAALFLGMQSSSPVTAALIMGTSPLTTNLLDAVLQRRLPRKIAVIGMGISLLGVALTVGAFTGARLASGDVLIFLGSLAWAFYTIGCRRWTTGATPLETSAWTMLAGALALVLAAVFLENPVEVMAAASATAWAATLWMALAGSVLAYICWQVGITVRGPGATSVLFNLVPVSALVVAAGFGRIPEPSQILGVAVAIFGVLLASGQVPGLRR